MSLVCKICFETPLMPQVTSCGHVFCQAHLSAWFQQSDHSNSCPVCRRILDVGADVITIYADQAESSSRGAAGGVSGDDDLDFSSVLDKLKGKWEKSILEKMKLNQKIATMEEEYSRLKKFIDHFEEETDLLKMRVRKDKAFCPAIIESRLTNRWECAQTYSIHKAPVHGIATHPREDYVATASWDHSCKVMDVRSGRLLATLNHNHKGLYAVQFSQTNDQILGTVSSDNLCRIWNFKTGECLRALEQHRDEVNALAFHSFKEMIATVSDDKTCILWDIARGDATMTLSGHANSVYGVKFQPYGSLVATGSFDCTAILWDERTGRQVHQFTGHTDDIIGVDFDDSGYTLATGSDDKTCRLWDLRTQSCLAVLNKHSGDVKRVAFSPYGRTLATSSGDMTARIWCMKTFSCVDTLKGHGDHVFDAAWAADSEYLVTASHDSKFKLWRSVP